MQPLNTSFSTVCFQQQEISKCYQNIRTNMSKLSSFSTLSHAICFALLGDVQRQQKIQRDRLMNDFSAALNNFQAIQRHAAVKEKESVARARAGSRLSVSRNQVWDGDWSFQEENLGNLPRIKISCIYQDSFTFWGVQEFYIFFLS